MRKRLYLIILLFFPSILFSQNSNSIFNNPVECICETCGCYYFIGASIDLPIMNEPLQFIGDRNKLMVISMNKEVNFNWGIGVYSNDFKIDVRDSSNVFIDSNLEIYSNNFNFYVWEGSSLRIMGDVIFNETSTIEIQGNGYICGNVIGNGTIIGNSIIYDCTHTITVNVVPENSGSIGYTINN